MAKTNIAQRFGPDWRNRLENWKFEDALKQIPELDPIRETDFWTQIEALAQTFGNSGWFDGKMGVIVGAAIDHILSHNPRPECEPTSSK